MSKICIFNDHKGRGVRATRILKSGEPTLFAPMEKKEFNPTELDASYQSRLKTYPSLKVIDPELEDPGKSGNTADDDSTVITTNGNGGDSTGGDSTGGDSEESGDGDSTDDPDPKNPTEDGTTETTDTSDVTVEEGNSEAAPVKLHTQEELDNMHYKHVDKVAKSLGVSTEGNKDETIALILKAQSGE